MVRNVRKVSKLGMEIMGRMIGTSIVNDQTVCDYTMIKLLLLQTNTVSGMYDLVQALTKLSMHLIQEMLLTQLF